MLTDYRMHDGSRHYASLPQLLSFNQLRAHLKRQPGVLITGYITDEVTEVWIDFSYSGHNFTVNNQFGEYWLFAQDPTTPDDVLERTIGFFYCLS